MLPMHLYVTGAKSWQTLREGKWVFCARWQGRRKLEVNYHKVGVIDDVKCPDRLIYDKDTCLNRSVLLCAESNLQTVIAGAV